jgi:alkaline phosphatase D
MSIRQFVWTAAVVAALTAPAPAAHLAMGFRVGELEADSAIVWTRITAQKERNWNGVRPDLGRKPNLAESQLDPTPPDEFEGATPGAPGEVRVLWSTRADLGEGRDSGWGAVDAQADFTRQIKLRGLSPATKYFLRVEARNHASAPISAQAEGSFTTPAAAESWQDVRLGVITCQGYHDLDDPRGYNIYAAMLRQNLHFIVNTGDNVYYDGDLPYAKTIGLARLHWQRMYSLPRHVDLFRTVPCYFEKDDHDVYANDAWPDTKPGRMKPLTWEEGLRVYREQVPYGTLPYRTFRWGKGLQIWLTEGRDFRSPNSMPDGPDKTIWGKPQRDWLMRTIEQSDAAFKLLISPTPIVGPDRPGKGDNHANKQFQHEGDFFRQWSRAFKNLYVCNGDRHWQYHSVDVKTRLQEFSCGSASDAHAAGSPGENKDFHRFHRVKGGYLTVEVTRQNDVPTIVFRFHDGQGQVVYEYQDIPRN